MKGTLQAAWRVAAVLLTALAAAAPAEVVTSRFKPAATDEPAVLQFDLKALAGKRVYRARLLCQRDPIDGADQEALVKIKIFPLRSAYRKGRQPQTEGEPLELAGPRYQWFDATKLVGEWTSGKRANHGLYVKAFPRRRAEQTWLDVTREGSLADPPPAVKGLKAFHRAGQTFLTWQEIESSAPREEIRWGDLRRMLGKLDEKQQLRYRIYRHTRRITADNLHQAELLAEVGPLSAFNVNARCIEYGVDKRLAEVDVSVPQQFDPFGGPTRESGLGLDYPVRRFVIDPEQGPLPPGTGLYVHTAAEKGKFSYAVTAAVNGFEAGANVTALSKPVTESPAEPQPVLQGRLPKSPHWDYPAKRYHYVQWCGPPDWANLPNVAFSYGVSIPDRPPPDGSMPMEIHFHPRGLSYYRPVTRVRRDSLVVCPYDFPTPSGWYGYHEAVGTLRCFEQGVVRNYTERRILAFLKWARKKWKIDEGRISVVGGAPAGGSAENGGGEAVVWYALRHRDFVNAAMASLPVIDTSTWPKLGGPRRRRRPSMRYKDRERVWGRREWNIQNAEGRPAWESQDCTALLKQLRPLDRAPYLAMGGRNEQITAFVGRLRQLRRAFWHHSSWSGSPLAMVDGTSGFAGFGCGIRLDRSLPAITPTSADSEKHPTFEHSARGRWDGGTIVDEPERYEVTLYTYSHPYPTKRMTAGVTPRRLRKFAVKAGAAYEWETVDPASGKKLQAGQATADEDGLLTLEGVEVTLEARRLILRPAGKATRNRQSGTSHP